MQRITLIILLLLLGILVFSCKKDTFDPSCNLDFNLSSCPEEVISLDSSKINRNVLIIGLDGFRSDGVREDITPFLFQLSSLNEVYFTGENSVEDHTISGPNWSSLLTGVHWCKHQVADNDFTNHALANYPSLFSYIENAIPSKNTASIVNWLPINEFLADPIADYAPMDSRSDEVVFQDAFSLLNSGNPIAPDVLFLHFDNLDAVGHSEGFDPNILAYKNALKQIDLYILSLFDLIDTKRQNGEDWLIAIVSDHGGDGTGHGGGQDNDLINKTIFFLDHPTESFRLSHTSSQVDLVPTVLDFLGIQNNRFDCLTDGISIIQ